MLGSLSAFTYFISISFYNQTSLKKERVKHKTLQLRPQVPWLQQKDATRKKGNERYVVCYSFSSGIVSNLGFRWFGNLTPTVWTSDSISSTEICLFTNRSSCCFVMITLILFIPPSVSTSLKDARFGGECKEGSK